MNSVQRFVGSSRRSTGSAKCIPAGRTRTSDVERGVSSGIDWFFSCEDEGIVLEDDCVPDPTFFAFCDALLERYRHEPRVMCITGNNFVAAHWQPSESYYFSRYVHNWGWATWRRAWRHYQVDLDVRSPVAISKDLRRGAGFREHVAAHWGATLQRVGSGKIDAWDYQSAFAVWRNAGVVCTPRTNLVSNIGFGAGATNTTNPQARACEPARYSDRIAAAAPEPSRSAPFGRSLGGRTTLQNREATPMAALAGASAAGLPSVIVRVMILYSTVCNGAIRWRRHFHEDWPGGASSVHPIKHQTATYNGESS